MGGGLMQIAAFGYQDIYLTGKPQITFFKLIYKRHTHFVIDNVSLDVNNADYGKKVSIIIPKAGDLISKCFIKISTPLYFKNEFAERMYYYENAGFHFIKSIELQIGETIIDKHYGVWLSIWNSLTLSKSKQFGLDRMNGNVNVYPSSLYPNSGFVGFFGDINFTRPVVDYRLENNTFYIPLSFWFCRYTNLALPCSIIKYQDIKFNIEFNNAENIFFRSGGDYSNDTISSVKLEIDYIHLDTDERYRFFNKSHEYLIEQLQFNGKQKLIKQQNNIKLDFKHPIKEIIWITTNDNKYHEFDFGDKIENTYPIIPLTSNTTPSPKFGGNYTLYATGDDTDAYKAFDKDDNTSFTMTSSGPDVTATFTLPGGGSSIFDPYVIQLQMPNNNKLLISQYKITVSTSGKPTNFYLMGSNGSTPYARYEECIDSHYNLAWNDNETKIFNVRGLSRFNRIGLIIESATGGVPTIKNIEFIGSLFDYTNNPTESAKILFNNQELFSEKNGRYFSEIQPYQHHTNIPDKNPLNKEDIATFSKDTPVMNFKINNYAKDNSPYYFFYNNVLLSNFGINVYSFALHPENIQPSGSCNFSKFDNVTLIHKLTDNAFQYDNNEISIFATNYNILRISDGMCELLYN